MKSACFFVLVFASFLIACDKKQDRMCKCTVKESGIVTTESEIAIEVLPGFPPIVTKDTSTAPYASQTSAVYNFSDVKEKHMNAACPRTSEEEVNEKLTSRSDATVSISITTTKVGTKTKTCEIQ
jgi:hypothetical protein